jgi:hypothetical protein
MNAKPQRRQEKTPRKEMNSSCLISSSKLGALAAWRSIILLLLCAVPNLAATKITFNEDRVLLVNGEKTFAIGFTMAPAPGMKAPNGRDGLQELHDAGGSFLRTGPSHEVKWNDKYIAEEQKWFDSAANAHMYCMPWLKELSTLDEDQPKRLETLKKVVALFKDQPAMGCWKGADEPEWGSEMIEPMLRLRHELHELDPDHPLWIIEAPMGTIDSLREYNDTMDITGQDIYPISYPPGNHSRLPNRDISLVGDHTRLMQEVVREEKPIWMTLQIAWSGVASEGRILRMPTLAQERFMAYEAIINGARGLVWFGGNLPSTLSPTDKQFGWNWSWFDINLRPLLAEINEKSPLYPALVARESEIPIRCQPEGITYSSAKEIEYCVREVNDDIFLLACNRSTTTVQVNFEQIPACDPAAEVMFESPRKVKVEKGGIQDFFGPFEVHVYRFHRQSAN